MKEFSYTLPGVYFITVCSYNRLHTFGDIENGAVLYSGIGVVAEKAWLRIAEMYCNVELDEFIVMPNHVHGILLIEGAGAYKRAGRELLENVGDEIQENSPKVISLSDIIHDYKSYTTNLHYKDTQQVLWQRGFYEHIIRGDTELTNVREYIKKNVINWKHDERRDYMEI